jgi:hypothetical protein
MAKKKKATPVKRKRLKKAKPVKPVAVDGPVELEGWKVGDTPWAVPFGSNKSCQLAIQKLNPKDSVPSLSCFDITTRRFCVVAVSWCADNKIKAKQLYLSRSKEQD